MTLFLDVFLPWLDVSVGRAILNYGQIKVIKKSYMEARHKTSMKKGWIYRTSYDEKNREIAPVMMTQ